MSKETGGSAFPVAEVFDERKGAYSQYGSEGMTLRDYFAANAMKGLSAHQSWGNRPYDEVAEASYKQADAMLAERAK